MDVVGAVASIMSCLCTNNSACKSLGKKCKNLRRPTRNLNKLITLIEELDARKVDLKLKLDQLWLGKGMEAKESVKLLGKGMEAKESVKLLGKGMEAKESVKLWMKNVDIIKREVNCLIDANKQQSESSGGLHFCSRIRLGECIEEKIQSIKDLLEKCQFADDSIAEAVPSKGNILPAPQLAEDATDMPTLERIVAFLLDVSVGRIGVYGMGGVGKTTIMTEINNRLLKESGPFDSVIWITISKEFTLEMRQKDIAKEVSLCFSSDNNETARASKLLEVLNRRKKFVLILDDLWEPFSLETIGIPIPTVENGCKLVITTRSLRICRGMETDQNVEVKVLSEDKAWNLFKAKIGDQVLTSPATESIAKDVAKECGGLPLAIITVGRALRNATDISEWESTLAELRVSSVSIDPMDIAVFSRLKLSFTRLMDDRSRSCFLYCALYPQGHLIDTDELIKYWMWESLLGDVNKISQSKSKGMIILNELKHACMLESTTQNGVECVKMHDLVRDMALAIMSTNCIVNAGTRLTKLTRLGEWTQHVQRVSLMRNDLDCIDFNQNCPHLSSLLLQYNSLEKNIIPDFFDNIGGLKVLDLSYTGIDYLPISLSSLQNLGALLLCHCWNLMEIPSLAKLTKLMVLDLSFSRKVRKLPHGMEYLRNLRRLNISWTMIEYFPYGLLSTFSLLEELLTAYSGVLWVSNEVNDELAGACIEELIISSTLSVVKINFLDFDTFSLYVKTMHWRVLSKYLFLVGEISECLSYTSRAVYLDSCSSIAKIPANTMELHLKNCRIMEPLKTRAPLKTCSITSCCVGKCIIDPGINNLSLLERMDLHSLDYLEMICEKTLGPGTLTNLKTLNVSNCDRLKRMFTMRLLLEMKNLEEITILCCWGIEYIIGGEDETMDRDVNRDAGRVNFPKLQRLKLYDMHNLKGICNGIVECNSLCTLEVLSCDNLRRLPLGLFGMGANEQFPSPPALKYIKGTKQWWESLEWDQPHAMSFLQALFQELTFDEIEEHYESNRRNMAGPSGSSGVVSQAFVLPISPIEEASVEPEKGQKLIDL